jgi:hypothetical protein
VIVHFNQSVDGPGSDTVGAAGGSAALTGRVVESLVALLHGRVDARTLSTLRIHLDWIQYRANFRDPVIVRRATDVQGRVLPLAEIAIDLRQADVDRLRLLFADTQRTLQGHRSQGAEGGPVYLDEFRPLRACLIWDLNRLFWHQLAFWETATGRTFDAALPGGSSDANHPQAIADSVGDFWTLLRDLENRGQLPAEIVALEIGVGSSVRARLWLDRFKTLDGECASGYYPRLKFLLGDYSPRTLEIAMANMGPHASQVSAVAMDAMNPYAALSAHRFKILSIHLTNVYDNLPFDEIVRRDGRLYVVEARPYLSEGAAGHLANEFGVPRHEIADAVGRLLGAGPEAFDDRDRGVGFWRCLWAALRLEERLRALDVGEDAHVPPGLTLQHIDDLLDAAPHDIRFHLSRGAAESFANTLPLLHPRGYLQVQDIFVSAMDDFRQGFKGPGKLDGSVVAWVNGPLLRAVAARAGYDVHFASFHYRHGSKTKVLYTTQRD